MNYKAGEDCFSAWIGAIGSDENSARRVMHRALVGSIIGDHRYAAVFEQ
ncbi:hypothetical protein DYBT9275_01032 [Dyadobacter sp. CECT 9275]|uniref:Uncharacterized protein n=1 Tax=Dyadobacter helix TaxID=2822344 RepID=A0A916JAH9_9BACT|nr:hypothetical protein DYBT9275_01032 [Dyadobacter sp. CECT 9275]